MTAEGLGPQDFDLVREHNRPLVILAQILTREQFCTAEIAEYLDFLQITGELFSYTPTILEQSNRLRENYVKVIRYYPSYSADAFNLTEQIILGNVFGTTPPLKPLPIIQAINIATRSTLIEDSQAARQQYAQAFVNGIRKFYKRYY